MNPDLEGKAAIVTGAAGGIGREIVGGLLGAGTKVAALDVDEARLGELAAGFGEASGAGRLLTARTDISSYAECEETVAHVRDALGGLHVLVNNGAMGMGTIRIDHMTELVGIRGGSKLYTCLPPDFFGLVVVDECHEGPADLPGGAGLPGRLSVDGRSAGLWPFHESSGDHVRGAGHDGGGLPAHARRVTVE